MKNWYQFKKISPLLSVTFLYGCMSSFQPSEEQDLLPPQTLEPPLTELPAASSNENQSKEVPIVFPVKEHPADRLTTLSLQDAASLVVDYHPRIAQAKNRAEGEKEMINIAKANYYPQISGGTRVEYDDQPGAGQRRDNTKLELEVRQTLFDFGKTANTVKSAEYSYQGAKINTSATNESFIHAATSALVESARQKQLISLAKQQINQVRSIVNLVEERHDQGASNLSDLLHAQSRLDEVQSEGFDTETRYQVQLQNLRHLTGAPHIQEVTIKNPPVGLKNACSLPLEWEQIPEYIMADLEAKKALAELEVARSEEKPTIYASGIISRDLDNNRTAGYRSRTDSKVSLNFSMPFYQGGSLTAQKRASESMAHAAAANKENVRLELSRIMEDAETRLHNMQNRHRLLTQRVKNLEGTRELYRRQYLDLGARSLVDLLNSEQEFHKARVDVVNNELNILQTQLDCAFYHGKLEEYFNIE